MVEEKVNPTPGGEVEPEPTPVEIPEGIIKLAEPLIIKAVQNTLASMDLPKLISQQTSQIANDVITKVGNQITAALPKIVEEQIDAAIARQTQTNPTIVGQTQPATDEADQSADQTSQLFQGKKGDIAFAAIMNKLLGGNTTQPDAFLKQMVTYQQMMDVLQKPVLDAQERTLRQINQVLGIGAKAGLSPQETFKEWTKPQE